MTLLVSFAAAVLSAIIIICPDIAVTSFKNSFILLTDTVIPSMFPFMIISQMVSLTKISEYVSLIFLPLFRVLKLPDRLSFLFLCSILGGYPTGIKSLEAMCRDGGMSTSEAHEYLPFLINAGPGFVVSAVGRLMFGSAKLGIILYFSQILSALITGRILYRGRSTGFKNNVIYKTPCEALIISVNDSSYAMLVICGFIVFFNFIISVSEIFSNESLFSNILLSVLEVSVGCSKVSNIKNGFVIASFLISFSGVSVICQVKSIGEKAGINTCGIVVCKFMQGILAALFTIIAVKIYPITESANLLIVPYLKSCSPSRLGEAILIGMMFCQILSKDSLSDR